MSELIILCVEDEPPVRDALIRDLDEFTSAFVIEPAEDVAEAREIVRRCLDRGCRIALVLCDHLLPDQTGVDFLVELQKDPDTRQTRKVLVTGQAGLEDAVKAINEASLQHFINKPWSPNELQQAVRHQLTEYAIAEVDDLLALVTVLDGPRLLSALRQRDTRND